MIILFEADGDGVVMSWQTLKLTTLWIH